jgi:D-Tyr-tRNAtyr deacylase
VGRVERGRFGAHMEVELVNDGPVTIVVELARKPGPPLPGP